MLAIGNKCSCKNDGGNSGDGGNNGGTVITNIYNFTGNVINGTTIQNFTITGGELIVNNNTIVIGGGFFLTQNYDYSVTNVNEITLNEIVNNTNITIINNYGGNLDSLMKGKFKNDIEALAGGVKEGELYRVTKVNDYGMSENFIKYLEPISTGGIF